MSSGGSFQALRTQEMRWNGLCATLALLLAISLESADAAPLTLVPRERPHAVFGGWERELEVIFRNSGAATVQANVRGRIYQASSATTAPVSEFDWKSIQVLPGQTIIEAAALRFPVVQAETRFLVRWVDGKNGLIGVTDVRVYPTNMLAQLRSLGDGLPVGVFDPSDQFKPLLRKVGVPYQDLLEDGTDQFEGKLAIFGPFPGAIRPRGSLGGDIRHLAKRGKAVVWLLPSIEAGPLRPSFEAVRFGEGNVVVAQQDLMLNVAEDPEAQMKLLRLAEYAMYPARLDMAIFKPETNPAP